MELREFFKILKKYGFFILSLGALGTVTSQLVTAKITEGARYEQIFYVQVPRENLDVYQFGGYYAQEKARNFTDSAVVILESPDFTSRVVGNSTRVSVRKIAPQVIRLAVTSKNAQIAQEEIPKIISEFNRELTVLTGENQVPKLVAVGQSSRESAKRPTKPIAAVFGFIAGGIFALMIAGLKSYLKL